jgi:deazaflavin-dependent oxidoreductase (nitroreductase family)
MTGPYPIRCPRMAAPPRRRRLSAVERRLERWASSKAGSWYYLHVATPLDRVLLPLTGGRVSVSPGQQVGLLDTVGAKSGRRRRTPLLFLRDGERVVLVASNGGSPRHPAWYWNVRKDPRVEFTGPGGLTGSYVAREAEGEERERLWEEAVDYYAGYDTYAGQTDGRVIPVVVLERAP